MAELIIKLNTEEHQELLKYKLAIQEIANYKQILGLPVPHYAFKEFVLSVVEKALQEKEAV